MHVDTQAHDFQLVRGILKARVFVNNAVFIGNGAYGLAVLFFGFEELRFRSAAHQPHMILQMTTVMNPLSWIVRTSWPRSLKSTFP